MQHQIFEGVGAVPIGPGDDLRLTIQCYEQAGGLNGRSIPYGVAVSLEVAPELGVDVYQAVSARVRPAGRRGGAAVASPLGTAVSRAQPKRRCRRRSWRGAMSVTFA